MYPKLHGDFEKDFTQTRKAIKGIFALNIVLGIIALIVSLAAIGVVGYVVVYALTHWLKW